MAKVLAILTREHLPQAMFNAETVGSYGPYYRMLTLVNSYDDPKYIENLAQGISRCSRNSCAAERSGNPVSLH
jgi:hypothetical protein